jgi:hypothetical protein
MSIIDSILNLFKPKPLNKEGCESKIKYVEMKKAESQLRFARERDKSDPNLLKADQYEREVAHWDILLKKLKEQLKQLEE